MRFTIFTPTYNRAYTIEKLYHSLQRQSFCDFEWIVVDDGSTDNTEEMFAGWLRECNNFNIQYLKTANGGKHRAINKGVELANGELFYIVDSDDYLPDDALQIINNFEKTIPPEQKEMFGGVCGQKSFDDGKVIGNTFTGDILDITTLERPKHNISGDKAEVFYTAVLRKYPFPEFEGEKFVTECVVWDKIANDGYKLRFFNRTTMICNYLPDGLSAKYNQLLIDNPKGYGLYIYQSSQFKKIQGLVMWNQIINYYSSLNNVLSFTKIAKYLHMNPIKLWFRLLGIKIFHKLYDHWE